MSAARRAAVLALLVTAAAGCRQDMHDQPRYEPFEASGFFEDGRSARPLVVGTVPRGFLEEDEHLYRGRIGGELAERFPFAVDRSVLERGRERYRIFCAPCHDAAGNGNGVVVQRGLKHPPSFHIERLRQAPPGWFFEVITKGYGAMYDYADRVPPADRWAITAYVRALQRSAHASLDDVPQGPRAELEAAR